MNEVGEFIERRRIAVDDGEKRAARLAMTGKEAAG